MRISVVHSTVYRYDRAVQFAPHAFRLRPREDGVQRLLAYEITIDPRPAGQSMGLDQDGNVTLGAWFDRPAEQLSVRSSFQVETLRENPFDFVVQGPLYADPLRQALAPYLAEQDTSGLAALAPRDAEPMAFLTALNATLYENFEHVVRDDGQPNPPEVTLRDRSGSCRDLAVLFCAACRARSIAARFVSGYEMAASFEEHGYMHAWAEVYFPGPGWRGYDPSRGLAVTTGHVAVAAAADPRLAAPVVGNYLGAARSKMEFAISMQAL